METRIEKQRGFQMKDTNKRAHGKTLIDIIKGKPKSWNDKKMLKRREECGKKMKYKELSTNMWLSSAVDVESMYTANESQFVGWKLYTVSFQWVLSASVMSTNVGLISVALFPSL